MIVLFYLFQLLVAVVFLPAALVWGGKALLSPRYREGWAERLGFWPRTNEGSVWVHGASVGEIRAVSPLIRALLDKGKRVLVTTTTSTGRAEAKNLLGEKGDARLLPLDFIPCVWLALKRAKPSALVIAETELWPALLYIAKRRGIPIFIITARISQRSLPRYLKIRPVVRWMLGYVDGIQTQTPEDAEKFFAIGARRAKVTVGGNMKFDLPPPETSDPVAKSLRRARAGGYRVIVAGSVHPGEARAVQEGIEKARKDGLSPGLVVAPRHLEKMEEIKRDIASAGGREVLYSALAQPMEASLMDAFREGRTVLVDRYGILGKLYGGAELAFVGGSLAPVGGHNLLEPLRWGIPVLFGPNMQSAREIRDAVLAGMMGKEVKDADALAEAVKVYLSDESTMRGVKSKADAFFAANHGATIRAVEALQAAGALDKPAPRQRQ